MADQLVEEEEEEEEVMEEICEELEPPKLDEPVYHVGDAVEVRSPGRHGWKEATVAGVDFGESALSSSAVGVYDVRRDADGSESKGLTAGNLRRIRDTRPPGLTASSSSSTACAPEEFALGRTFPPPSIPAASAEDDAILKSESKYEPPPSRRERLFRVGDRVEARFRGGQKFLPATVTAVNEPTAGSPTRPSKRSGASTYDLRYDDDDTETGVAADMVRASRISAPLGWQPLASISVSTDLTTRPGPSSSRGGASSSPSRAVESAATSTPVGDSLEAPDEEKAGVTTSALASPAPPAPSQQAEIEVSPGAPAAPTLEADDEPLASLFRYAANRGIDCKQWFTPVGEDAQKRLLLSQGAFEQKVTGLGLGLGAGRPVEEQMRIERALATSVIDEAMAVARVESATGDGEPLVDVDLLLEQSSITASVLTERPAAAGATCEGDEAAASAAMAAAMSMAAATTETTADTAATVATAAASLAPTPTHAPAGSPAAAAGLEDASGSLPADWGTGAASSPVASKGPTTEQVSHGARWKIAAEEAGAALKAALKRHPDTYHALRCWLGLTHVVGTEDRAAGGKAPVAPTSFSQAELTAALYHCELRWNPVKVQALMRWLSDADGPVAQVSSTTLNRTLLKLRLTHMVNWHEWSQRKQELTLKRNSLVLTVFGNVLKGGPLVQAPLHSSIDEAAKCWAELAAKFERLPSRVADVVIGDENYELFRRAEAGELAQAWLATSAGRREVRQQLAAGATAASAPSQHDANADEDFDLEDEGLGGGKDLLLYSEYRDEKLKSKAPVGDFNTWLDDRLSLKDRKKTKAAEERAVEAHIKQILESDDQMQYEQAAPYQDGEFGALIVLVEDAPAERDYEDAEDAKGACELARRTEGGVIVAVAYRPMLFTKKLLGRYLEYRRELAESVDAARLLGRTSEESESAAKSFIDWLADVHEEREKRQKELLKWRRTKQKMAQRKNAEASCVAVLCLDAATNRDAETLDSELRNMEGWQDGHGLGARVEARLRGEPQFLPGRISRDNFDGTYGVDFDNGEKEARVPKDMVKAVSSEVVVHRHTRLGLDLTQRMRRLAADAKEVAPVAPDTSARDMLKLGLEKVFKKYLFQQEKAFQAHKDSCATPHEAGEDVVSGVVAKHVRPASGRSALAAAKKPRPPLQGGKVRKKKPTKADPSRPKLSRGEAVEATFLGGRSWYPARVARVVEHHQELEDGAVSTEIRYDIFYPKSSRRGRIEEAVRLILQRCGDAGEVYTSSEDQEKEKVQFEFDEAKGLAGQQRILKQLGDDLLANVSSLEALEWIGPVPKLGTAMNARNRRTHAYVVPKSAVDKAFEPVLMSITADPNNASHAKSMLGVEFRSKGKKPALSDATNGLYQGDLGKQKELAASLAAERDRLAEQNFREWHKEKQLEARRKQRAQRAEAKKKKAEEAQAAAENKKCFKKWLKLKEKDRYFSVNKQKAVPVPPRSRITSRAAWAGNLNISDDGQAAPLS